ncbi:MAG: helix-turn-helix domain-containing protein [Chloroflexales bacterium]
MSSDFAHALADGPAPLYLTCQEVADRWRCSKATVYRRIGTGKLDTIGDGALLRVTLESLLRYEAEIMNRRRAS